MKLKTDILFTFMLRTIKPCMVLDIGSRDGLHAVLFKKIVPNAKLISFEANPYNYEEIVNTKKVVDAGIVVVNNAVSDKNAELTFNVVKPTKENNDNKGVSSLRERGGWNQLL